MKRSSLFALLAIGFCVPIFAGSTKSKFKVTVIAADSLVKARVGDSLELTLKPESFTAIDKTCAQPSHNAAGNFDCPEEARNIVAAQFPLSAVSNLIAGRGANFVSVIWTMDGKIAKLVLAPNVEDFPLLVGILEEATGKKAVSADAQPTDRPRVFLRSQSFGNQWAGVRNQSMEMATDFGNVCPIVLITINEQKADFTIGLNHIEVGLIGRDNQVQVYNKDGDLISGREGGSIEERVKCACGLIVTSWEAERRETAK
jgi:hypothetical protein